MERLNGILARLGIRSSHQVNSEERAGESNDCPICRGRGWVVLDVPLGHPDFGKAFPCECKLREFNATAGERLFRFCELPESTKEELTFDRFEVRPGTEEAYEAARALAEGRAEFKWLTLSGAVGSGKSHLGIAVVLERLKRGRLAKYVYVPDFLDQLRASFQPEAEMSYEELFGRYKDVELLFLDDLGTEHPTSWVQEKLEQLLEHRYIRRLELVVATNKAANELPGRIVDRLRDSRIGRVIDIDVPSYRTKIRVV